MKKIYNVPTVVTLNVRQMLASSPTPQVGVDTGGSGVNPQDLDTRQKNNGIGGGLWSDMQ